MKAHFFLLTYTLSTALASPLPQSSVPDDCKALPLSLETWNNLGIENLLANWTNDLAPAASNNVQNLASSFGAPNFFCGLDSFCNAGQPCSPVKLPQWYSLVAIQNWNAYMNQLYTALIATSNILTLKLPSIVTDLSLKPRDEVTPLKTFTRVFAGALSIIPFTGTVSTAVGAISSTSSFISTNLQVPTPPDEFLQWSNIAASVAKLVPAWQASVSNSIQATVDAQANTTGGIFEVIRDGKFLGAHRNVTQAELQDNIMRSMELYTIGVILQSSGVFIFRGRVVEAPCSENRYRWGPADYCMDEGNGRSRSYSLLKRDKHDGANPMDDLADKLLNNYKMTKEQLMPDPAECFEAVGRKQGEYPFGDMLPIDPSTKCIFNLQICDSNSETMTKGIIKGCRNQGVNVDA